MNDTIVKKYNIPGPRYTSYPAVPHWQSVTPTSEDWCAQVKSTFNYTNKRNGISIYIHLPYCESLCTYCGCTTRITVNHSVEMPYIEAVLQEWKLYLDVFEEVPEIAEIHLGGGTPTFFSPDNLKFLIEGIKKLSLVRADAEFSFEGHPNSTKKEHLQTLFDLGFRRVSFGIQDFDPKVQEIVNRIQTYETVSEVVHQARTIGYTSINFDLIYGLPLQTKASIIDTFEKVAQLQPDRIAYYSYAHVPWIKPGQRKFTAFDLPDNEEKRALYELGKEILSALKYHEIGMDHFSVVKDDLYQASQNGLLHRNFMGYTTSQSQLTIGLGVSAISDTWTAYAQNVKTVEPYIQKINNGEMPIFKGHLLTDNEKFARRHITSLMCKLETSWQQDEMPSFITTGLDLLNEMKVDGLINIEPNGLQITKKGRPFVRNVCMAFDAHLQSDSSKQNVFSKVI